MYPSWVPSNQHPTCPLTFRGLSGSFGITVNALVYGIIGGGVAVLLSRFMGVRYTKNVTPTCAYCLSEWQTPITAKCPECGCETGFERWLDQPIPGAQCTNCGYDLRGIGADHCPECNEPIERLA